VKKTILTTMLVFILTNPASAQLPSKPFSIYIQGGLSAPQEDFNSLYKLGYHGAAGIGFSVFPRLEAAPRVSYHKFSPESDAALLDLESLVDFDGGDLTMIMYGVDLKLNLGLVLTHPYLLAGYGRARFDIEDVTFSLSGVEHTETFDAYTDSYWVLAGGLEFTRTFVEGRYITFLDGDDDGARRLITLSVGLRL